MQSIKRIIQLARNMGPRYIAFRSAYEFSRRSGLLRKRFPQNPPRKEWISLAQWKKLPSAFVINGRLRFEGNEPALLLEEFKNLKSGKLNFFNCTDPVDLGREYDWLTNPATKYRYPSGDHWTLVNDFDVKNGDIKYVWEKSRFSFLHTILRHDAYSGDDNSAWVWDEILSWIRSNAINSGPNYKCSQEMSLRMINWTFALNFYKDSQSLTEDIFQEIMHNVYWQLKHVYSNINFSRIAVRNNHAITETLMLYIGGLVFPFFPEASAWKKAGKKWFEEEIAYQVYPDGTFLQFSMNYHRVVVQLFNLAFAVAEKNNERFADFVYERACRSLDFLYQCQETSNGWLPNYGSNDGALFFKFTNSHYRDYRPQLNCLCTFLTGESLYAPNSDIWSEEAVWFAAKQIPGLNYNKPRQTVGWHNFEDGGYYLLREREGLTFIRCGNHKDRPLQADNLHIDIWYKGKNILYDGGSYKYNTSDDMIRYFMGTASHNTVMLDDHDQMLKGSRFIWYNWTQKKFAPIGQDDEYFTFTGEITVFSFLDPSIRQRRTIKKHKNRPIWLITDEMINKPIGMTMRQLFHPDPENIFNFASIDENGGSIEPVVNAGYVSSYYGLKEDKNYFSLNTATNKIQTELTIE
jgi:hypothetical protein